jgi:ABC-type amino acid transport substrate-binding protein
VIFPSHTFADQVLLSPQQNAWLDQHKRIIVVHPQESDQPYVFSGSGTSKEIKGFSVEYLQAVAKKLNVTISFTEPEPFDQVLANARERVEGIILSVTPTPEREQYLYFTEAYYQTPAVIAVRKDFVSKKSVSTLADFSDKKVAVGNGYAVQGYIKVNYPAIKLISVPDDQTALQKLLLGDVDAVVMDFGSLSYYTSNDVLSYVKVVGRTGFEYKHSIAVPKSSPELVLILNQGLKSISEAEKQVIINKWLQIAIPESSQGDSLAQSNNTISTLSLWLIFTAFIIFIVATIIIVLLLRRRGYHHPRVVRREREVSSEVKEELEELKIARETLKEDMEQIAALEKDIEKKIEGIDG